jgi:acyl carrier protein
MIPSFFVALETLPLTTSGKVDRKALPLPEKATGATYVAPQDELESKLADIWGEVLMLSVPIGIDDHFFRLGGHSLKAVTLLSKIHKVFNVKLPLLEIFKKPTIRKLSSYIREAVQEQYMSVEAIEKKDYYVLSSAQKRLFFLHQMGENEITYNMPATWILEGDVDKAKMIEAFKKLIQRHESLRTIFHMVYEEPVQRIHELVEFEIENDGLFRTQVKVERQETGAEEGETATCNPQLSAALISAFIRPFDLTKAPLFRVGLMEVEEGKQLLIVDMHHIISDGKSTELMVKDFMALYSEEELSVMKLQYKDFSSWQNSVTQKESLIKQKDYWKKQLEGEIPVLDLPCDYNRPKIQQFEGDAITFTINQEEVNALQSLALAEGVTLYMILLGSYYILLSKLSNQEDILVGTPIAGRRHADLEQIIGMFVNTLVLRNLPEGDKTYRVLLKEIKKRLVESFENQDYPYEELVEDVTISRDSSRNPLFDTMFGLQNMTISRLELQKLQLVPYEGWIRSSKFDLSLKVWEVEEKLNFVFEYSTSLFKKDTIERYKIYLKRIISTVVSQPDIIIENISLLSEEEKKQLLLDFNDTAATGYPINKTICKLFEEQVEQIPGHIALVGKEEAYKGGRTEDNKEVCLSFRE